MLVSKSIQLPSSLTHHYSHHTTTVRKKRRGGGAALDERIFVYLFIFCVTSSEVRNSQSTVILSLLKLSKFLKFVIETHSFVVVSE